MNITIESLRSLIKKEKRENIGTVEALLFDVCDGNEAASRMLHQLIWWWNSDGKPEFVYKSHKDWYNELRLKRGRVDTAVKVLSSVCEIKIKKAQGGNPTRHFALNVTAFLRRLSDILDVSIERINSILTGQTIEQKTSKPLPQKQANVCSKSEQTLTTAINNNHNQQPKQQQQSNTPITPIVPKQHTPIAAAENIPPEVVELFKQSSSAMIAQYGYDRVVEVCTHVTRRNDSINPPGLARHLLETNGLLKTLEPAAVDDDPMRFVTGEFADFIER